MPNFLLAMVSRSDIRSTQMEFLLAIFASTSSWRSVTLAVRYHPFCEPMSGLVAAINRAIPQKHCKRGTQKTTALPRRPMGRKVSTRVWQRGIQDPGSCESCAVRCSREHGKSDRRFAPFTQSSRTAKEMVNRQPGAVVRPYQSTPFLHEFDMFPCRWMVDFEHSSNQVPSSISKQFWTRAYEAGKYGRCEP